MMLSILTLRRKAWLHLALAHLLLGAAPVWCGVIPGRWEKLEAQETGLPLIVTLQTGERVEAAYLGLEAETLSVRPAEGGVLRVPKSAVAKVETPVRDSVRDGVLLGAAIGFAAPVIAVKAWDEATGPRSESFEVSLAIGFLFGAPAGALIGWAIDASRKELRILYRAP